MTVVEPGNLNKTNNGNFTPLKAKTWHIHKTFERRKPWVQSNQGHSRNLIGKETQPETKRKRQTLLAMHPHYSK